MQYPIKKKTRFDFYKSIQNVGFHVQQIQEHLNLGLIIPEAEKARVEDYIADLGSALALMHTTLQNIQYEAEVPIEKVQEEEIEDALPA
jgi:hypothetical protein